MSSFISDLLFFFSCLFSSLLFHLLVSSLLLSRLLFSCIVLSLFLCLSLSLSVSVFFLCLFLFLSVSVSVSLCLRVVLCGVCGVVCGAAWHAEKPPCVDAKRPRVYRHHAHMCYHMCAWCRYTRKRFASTHGGFLDGHTEGRGSSSVLLTKIWPRVVITCFRGSPQETNGSYPFSV